MIDQNRSEKTARLLGVGFDNADGHVRITRGDRFDILFGSEKTHDKMRETCVKIDECLRRKGRRLDDLSRQEFVELVVRLE